MTRASDIQKNDDLAFFGKVNASISHELKNILAIISEAAGLLNDLTEMAAKGENVDSDMLKSCSQDIIEEIERGFATIKQMNKFSHSVDDPLKSVNLSEVLDLMIGLAGFLSFAGRVQLVSAPQDAPTVLTCPFRLQNLIYQALVFAFESTGPEAEIRVSIQADKSGRARINFSGLGSKSEREFPAEQTQRIADSISVEIRVNGDLREVDILVPEIIEAIR
jgi:C4-dicarboxylate-specific signal transduction histidine kinase